MKAMLTRREVMLARGLAVAADLLQWVMFPVFMSGVTGFADGVLDVVVCIVMVRLLGWHIAFLPGFVSELVPLVNMVPMWTLAVFFATRNWKDSATIAEPLPASDAEVVPPARLPNAPPPEPPAKA